MTKKIKETYFRTGKFISWRFVLGIFIQAIVDEIFQWARIHSRSLKREIPRTAIVYHQ